MTKTTLQERIAADLENAIDDIFQKYQDELNIEDGGIDPLLAFNLENAQNELAKIIHDAIQYQNVMNRF